MTGFDLTNTAIANAQPPKLPPRPNELFAVQAALEALEQRRSPGRPPKELRLTEADLDIVATIIREELPLLAAAFGDGARLEARLNDMVGIRIFHNRA